MAERIRVIVVNADEDAAPELRAHLLGLEGVNIVAEIDEPSLLPQALAQFQAEVLLVHLDPNPVGMMEAIAPLIEAHKGRIAAVCMTEDRNAELVVRAMRAGMKEFLWKPFPPEQLNEILQRVGAEGPRGGGRIGRVMPVVGTAGGSGATCIAANLAVELAQLEGYDTPTGRAAVAVVDLDFRFGQVAMYLDAQPQYTIAELCDTSGAIESDLLERVMFKHPTGVHVLAHPVDLAQAENISAANCASVLAALQSYYDYVVVDGPVRMDATAKAVFDMTDVHLVVFQLLVPCVRNTERMLHDMSRNGFSMDRVRLVCNRLGRDAGLLEPADVEVTLGRKIDWFIPDDWKTCCTAVNMGATLMDYAPKSKLRAAFQKMAAGVSRPGSTSAERGEPVAAGDAGGKRGLFSFLAGGQRA
ncbi:MAG: hypothetical protein IPM64_09245 [Phycisphaerales bacterium]|nr:hypothetical protein [Phycisphaerales bacterium]